MRQFLILFLWCIFYQVTVAQLQKPVPLNPPFKNPIATKRLPVPPVSNNTNNATSPPPTLEELNQKVSDLEVLVNNLDNEISFKNFKVITVTANSANLFEWSLQNEYQNYVTIRIDDLLCNNNPQAKIFYSPTSPLVPVLQFIYYKAPYWYARFCSMVLSNLGPYDITDFHGAGISGNILTARKFNLLSSYQDAIQLGNRVYLSQGEKFMFAVFIPGINININMHGRVMNQK